MTTRRQFLNLAGAALATPALPRLASGAELAGAADPRDGPVLRRQHTRHRRAHRARPAVEPARPDHRGGEPRRRRRIDRHRRGRQGRSRRLLDPDQRLRAFRRPAAYPNITYDPARDFSAVIPFGTVPNVTVIAPAKGIKTMQELVEAAKSGSLTYASAGVGSATHWAAERLRVSAGFQAVHVPFRGGPEALTEVMTGRVDFSCMGMASALGFIRDGKLIPLAVSTAKRSSALPDVPTTMEAGLGQLRLQLLDGDVRAGEDAARHRRAALSGDAEGVAPPGVTEKFKPQGIEPMPLTPAEFDALIKKEIDDQHRAGQGGRPQVQLIEFLATSAIRQAGGRSLVRRLPARSVARRYCALAHPGLRGAAETIMREV